MARSTTPLLHLGLIVPCCQQRSFGSHLSFRQVLTALYGYDGYIVALPLVASATVGYPAWKTAISLLPEPVMTIGNDEPDFDKGDGLVPVVVQDFGTGQVLMLAYMNREAYNQTLATGQAVYYSRSRGGLWRKGQTSGNVQHVRQIRIDCDRDTLLLEVEQVGGAACHKGYASCFFRQVTPNGLEVITERVFDPAEVYRSPKE